MFLRFGLKERDCSLHHTGESNPVPNETHRAGWPRWRAAERKQCSATTYFVARNCRAATRSAANRRVNTTSINDRTNELPSNQTPPLCALLVFGGMSPADMLVAHWRGKGV